MKTFGSTGDSGIQKSAMIKGTYSATKMQLLVLPAPMLSTISTSGKRSLDSYFISEPRTQEKGKGYYWAGKKPRNRVPWSLQCP